jgi:hypothetical protein
MLRVYNVLSVSDIQGLKQEGISCRSIKKIIKTLKINSGLVSTIVHAGVHT